MGYIIHFMVMLFKAFHKFIIGTKIYVFRGISLKSMMFSHIHYYFFQTYWVLSLEVVEILKVNKCFKTKQITDQY